MQLLLDDRAGDQQRLTETEDRMTAMLDELGLSVPVTSITGRQSEPLPFSSKPAT